MRGSDYAEFLAFVAVAQERSFRRAAARLGLSPSALSHTVRALEERLGARLLHRTTRSVAPTQVGAGLLERLGPALADIAGAVEAVRGTGTAPSGTVRVNLPRLAAELVLAHRFAAFAAAHPMVRLELTVEDDLSDIVAGGFDAGIRPGERVQRDMVAVRVTPDLRGAVVAAPAYLARRSAPLTPRDLAAHACINYRFTGSGALYRWPFQQGDERLDVAVEGPLTLNDTNLIVAAALDGVGLACMLEERVSGHLAAGRLVRVLEDWCPPFPGFFLYYPGRRQTPPALLALVEFLRVRG